MSRIQELKKQNPALSRGFIDHINMLFPNEKSKYIDLFINLYKNRMTTESFPTIEIQSMEKDLIESGFDLNHVNGLSDLEKIFFYRFLNHFISSFDYVRFKSFINLNERNLIETNDITTIKSFNQLINEVSKAEIKSWDKELENQILIILDNKETGWLLIRPLTYESSKKYGSSTKWCTTQHNDPTYFYRYYRNILVYCINRKTGYKVAMNHTLEESETTFWDSSDHRIDSMMTELDGECINTLINEIKSGKSNRDITPVSYLIDEEKYNFRGAGIEFLNTEIPQEEMVPVGGGNIIPISQNGPDIETVNQTYNFPDWVTTLADQGPDTRIIND